MVIQSDALVADHTQPCAVATWKAPVVAAAPTLTLGGLTLKVQPEPWVTETV
jgi:hypothetical protein